MDPQNESPIEMILNSAKAVEKSAYMLAGTAGTSSVARLILLAHQLETQALRIAREVPDEFEIEETD
ncbi:MAG: hypothetical protein N4A70_18125 [Pelagimonas sp.]|jgi:HPt (histidine-containing phosphotransfer) domain-containing protein|nr:hypothetical protein [Pelagimonas sp.]